MDPDPKYEGSLLETCREIDEAGGTAVAALQADLSKPDDRERMFAEVVTSGGSTRHPGEQRRGDLPPTAR